MDVIPQKNGSWKAISFPEHYGLAKKTRVARKTGAKWAGENAVVPVLILKNDPGVNILPQILEGMLL